MFKELLEYAEENLYIVEAVVQACPSEALVCPPESLAKEGRVWGGSKSRKVRVYACIFI